MFNKYPYTDAHQINLDYILKQMNTLTNKVNTFSGEVSDYEQFKSQQIVKNNSLQSDIQMNTNRINYLSSNKADEVSVPGTAVDAIKKAQLDINTPAKTLEAAINYLATLIPNPNIFIAEYGQTAFDNIIGAINEGRMVIAHRYNEATETDEYYHLSWYEHSEFANSVVFSTLGYEWDTEHPYPSMINKIKHVHNNPQNIWAYYEQDI